MKIEEKHKKLQKLADPDAKIRPHLSGVCFDASRKVAVATDGAKLAAVYYDGDGSGVFDLRNLKPLLRDQGGVYQWDENGLQLNAHGRAVKVAEASDYPDVEDAVGHGDALVGRVTVSGKALCELIQALQGDGKDDAVTIEFSDRVAVATKNGCGVLMPMRKEYEVTSDVMGDLKGLVCKK